MISSQLENAFRLVGRGPAGAERPLGAAACGGASGRAASPRDAGPQRSAGPAPEASERLRPPAGRSRSGRRIRVEPDIPTFPILHRNAAAHRATNMATRRCLAGGLSASARSATASCAAQPMDNHAAMRRLNQRRDA